MQFNCWDIKNTHFTSSPITPHVPPDTFGSEVQRGHSIFSTRARTFYFTRLPYGLTNAPAVFQRIIDNLIKAAWEPYVFAYLDDVIIISPTFEHVKWLEIVLSAFKVANLQINLKKSEFCCAEVKYLGYIVNEDGLKTDEDKVKPILEYPTPFNVRQLRRFLGMIGWYSRFITHLAEYKAPLTKLLRKDVRWQWNEEQQQAFERLKLALTQASVLAKPDLSLPFTLQTDEATML